MKHIFFTFIFFGVIFNSLADEVTIEWSAAIGWYPILMENEDIKGEFYGLSVDLMEEIAKRLGMSQKLIKDLPFKRMLTMLEVDQLDMVVGIYYLEERNQKFHFTPPFLKNRTHLFVNKNRILKFEKIEDLKGSKIGKPLGGKYGNEFENFIKENCEVTEFTDRKQGTYSLLHNRIDMYISDYYDMTNYLKVNGYEDSIIPLRNPIGEVEVYAVISRNSSFTKYFKEIEKVMNEMKDDGTIDKLAEKYN